MEQLQCLDVGEGINPHFSPDGASIYLIRGAPRSATYSLLTIDLKTRRETPLGEIGPFRSIDRHFDVSSRGVVAWAPILEGPPELWAARIGR